MDRRTAPFPKSGFVQLNVGGQLYSTTVETLTRKSKFFEKLAGYHEDLSSGLTLVGDAFFLDRDGVYFDVILKYLRSNLVPDPESRDKDGLRKEGEYFMLDEEFFENLSKDGTTTKPAADQFDVEVETPEALEDFRGVHRKRPAEIAFLKNITSAERVYKCPRNIHSRPGGCGSKCRSAGEGHWTMEDVNHMVVIYKYKD
eukprot:jgi/Botrbrau1/22883/Bobra.0065s0037.1